MTAFWIVNSGAPGVSVEKLVSTWKPAAVMLCRSTLVNAASPVERHDGRDGMRRGSPRRG